MELKLYAVRGATHAENTEPSITKAVGDMCRTLFERNGITDPDRIVSVQFTMTPDLDAANAATSLRRSDVGIDTSHLALFTAQEARTAGMRDHVIRVLVTAYLPAGSTPAPVYINGAQNLRPDIS